MNSLNIEAQSILYRTLTLSAVLRFMKDRDEARFILAGSDHCAVSLYDGNILEARAILAAAWSVAINQLELEGKKYTELLELLASDEIVKEIAKSAVVLELDVPAIRVQLEKELEDASSDHLKDIMKAKEELQINVKDVGIA